MNNKTKKFWIFGLIAIVLLDIFLFYSSEKICDGVNYISLLLALAMQSIALIIFSKKKFKETQFLWMKFRAWEMLLIFLAYFFGSFYLFWDAGTGAYLAGGSYYCDWKEIF